MKLDRTQPYGTIAGHAAWCFEQRGRFFNNSGEECDATGRVLDAPEPPESVPAVVVVTAEPDIDAMSVEELEAALAEAKAEIPGNGAAPSAPEDEVPSVGPPGPDDYETLDSRALRELVESRGGRYANNRQAIHFLRNSDAA